MTKELIKIDRNGSKHWRMSVKCDRCGGDGIYKWGAMINGRPQYAGTCFKCEGRGWVLATVIERTPEYQAKLDAKNEAKQAARRAKWEAERARIEEEQARRKAEEERREAERRAAAAVSQFVGNVGDKLSEQVTYIGSPYFERASFRGYGTETCYIHSFKDGNGNKLVWKTSAVLDLEEGQAVTITGTVKEHSEYRDEKQTILTRCKVAA